MAALAKLIIAASIALPLSAQAVSDELAKHAAAAQEAERRNDFASAVREYSLVANQLPQSAAMQSNLGVALYFDHDLTRALAAFRKAMSLDSTLFAPHLFAGLALYRMSNPDAAVPELETAARINPSDAIARTWLGYAYSAQLRYQAALEEFEAAAQLDPQNIDVWYALGETQLQVGKAATLQLLSVAPDGGRTWQLAGEQAQLRGNREEALSEFLEAFHRRPDIAELPPVIAQMGGTLARAQSAAPPAHNQEDILYSKAHKAELQARLAFERVLKMAPDSYRAHQIQANALVTEQRLEEAIAEYRTVLRLNPDLPGIHEAIGKGLLSTGKEAEALKEFQAELTIQPDSASACMYAGQVLLLMGNDEAARKMLNRALHLNRPPPETYRALGKLDLHARNYQAAVKELNDYLLIKTNDASAYYLLSKAYQALEKKEQMRRALVMFARISKEASTRARLQARLDASSAQTEFPEEKVF